MRCLIGVDRVDIIGAKDEHCFTINIYFGSAILAIENAIALFHGHRKVLTLVVDAAFANSENDTGLRLLLRIRSDVEATCRGFLSFVLLNDDAIAQAASNSYTYFLSFNAFAFECLVTLVCWLTARVSSLRISVNSARYELALSLEEC